MDVLILVVGICGAMLAVLVATASKSNSDYDYHRGWRDHEELMRQYGTSPNDEALLKELKQAVKLYVKTCGLYKSGDVKYIETAGNWKEFKDIAWELTVLRKERK